MRAIDDQARWVKIVRELAAMAAVLAYCSDTAKTWAGSEESEPKDTPATAESDEQAAERMRLRELMGRRLRKIAVTLAEDSKRSGELVKSPLLTYTDEPRFVNAGTMWAWTLKKDARPIAMCKIEHFDPKRLPQRPSNWLYCFNSLSHDLIHAEWPDGHQLTSRQPGVLFQKVPDAPAASDTPSGRLRTMKEISRRFSASFDFNNTRKEELRLLTRPLYRYADDEAGIVDGAVFAVTWSGTNPTAVFLIELQKEQDKRSWKFAVAGMTDGGVVVRYDEKEVWSKPTTFAPGKSFDTWTYFPEATNVED